MESVESILENLGDSHERFGNVPLIKVSLEDCQTTSILEKGDQQEVTKPEAWADSTEENDECGNVSSEKPQEDLMSEPATPRTVQKQIFGTDTELSDVEPASVLSIWGDDVTKSSSKSTAKKPITYCTLCRTDSHSEKECIDSRFVQVDKKKFSMGDSKKSKQGKSVKSDFLRKSPR